MFIMSDRKVTIENMTRATVTLVIESANFKRKLKGEGAKTPINFSTLYDGLSEPGVMTMFIKGFLRVVDKQDRIDLGLDEAESIEEVKDITMTSAEMLTILKESNPIKIKETFEQLVESQRLKLVQTAIENDIYNAGLAKFVKDYTGIDLVQALSDYKLEQDELKEL